jgi:hypothetical protein
VSTPTTTATTTSPNINTNICIQKEKIQPQPPPKTARYPTHKNYDPFTHKNYQTTTDRENPNNESSIQVLKKAKTYLAIDQKKRINKLGNLFFDSHCGPGKPGKSKYGNVSMGYGGASKKLDKSKGNMSVEIGAPGGLDTSHCGNDSGVHSKGTLVGKGKHSTAQRGSSDQKKLRSSWRDQANPREFTNRSSKRKYTLDDTQGIKSKKLGDFVTQLSGVRNLLVDSNFKRKTGMDSDTNYLGQVFHN